MKQGDVTTQDEARILPGAVIAVITRDTTLASGPQGVVIGFTPSSIHFLCTMDGVFQEAGSWGFACREGSGDKSIRSNHLEVANQFQKNGTIAINMAQSAANFYFGDISSYNDDGFTINWVKVGSPTGILGVQFMAVK